MADRPGRAACDPPRAGQPPALDRTLPSPSRPGRFGADRCSNLGPCGSGELPEPQNRGRPTTDLRLSVDVTGRSNDTEAAPRASQGRGGRHVGCPPTLRPLRLGFSLHCWPSPGPQCPIGTPRRSGPQFGRRDQARIFGIDLQSCLECLLQRNNELPVSRFERNGILLEPMATLPNSG